MEPQPCPAKKLLAESDINNGTFKLCAGFSPGGWSHSEQVDSSHDVTLGEVGEQNTLPGNPWAVTLQLRTKDVKFNIDIGAEVTVISEAVRRDIGQPSLLSSDRTLTLKSFQHEGSLQGN